MIGGVRQPIEIVEATAEKYKGYVCKLCVDEIRLLFNGKLSKNLVLKNHPNNDFSWLLEQFRKIAKDLTGGEYEPLNPPVAQN